MGDTSYITIDGDHFVDQKYLGISQRHSQALGVTFIILSCTQFDSWTFLKSNIVSFHGGEKIFQKKKNIPEKKIILDFGGPDSRKKKSWHFFFWNFEKKATIKNDFWNIFSGAAFFFPEKGQIPEP